MSDVEYDVAILGSGPAGYVAGIRASQLKLKACVIEKDKPGGVCLNIGCIPSKAIIHEAEGFAALAGMEELGIKVDRAGLDYSKVLKKSRDAADAMARGVTFLLKKNNVPLVQGTGKITARGEITLGDGKKIRAKNILVATGSSPKQIPGFEFDGKIVISSDGALMLSELPKRILILGGGAIGCEFAHILSAFGVEVILVEMLDHLLPLEDAETVAVLERSFKKRGITVLTGTKALEMKKGKGSAAVTLEEKGGKKRTEEVDKVLVVVGRGPNTGGIGLENVGIKTDRGFIPVCDYYQTEVPGIYAAGDVTASPLLAHVASKEAEIAVEHMAGHPTIPRIDPDTIPGAVYTEPQVASFGVNEERAKREGIAYAKAVFPYRGAGKSVAIGKSDGHVKVLYDPKTHEILGAHIVGAEGTELIHELLLAKYSELLPEDIATMIHAHPTLSEAVMETARTAEGWVIHV